MEKNLEIERLRAVAILLVMLGHFPATSTLLPPLLLHTWVGVDLFFVISGFVVSLALMRLLPDFSGLGIRARLVTGKAALKKFYLRRIHRIIPLVFTWMTVNFLLACVFSYLPSAPLGTPSGIAWENFLFCTGLFNYLHPDYAIQGQLWSLNVEEHFYLLLPLLFVFVPTRSGRVKAVLAGICLVIFVLRPFTQVPFRPDSTSHRRFDELFFGVLLALTLLNRKRPFPAANLLRIPKPIWAPLLIVLLWLAPAVIPITVFWRIGYTVNGLIGMALVFLATREQGYIFGNGRASRCLEYIGSRSYGLYLCHVPLSLTKEVLIWLMFGESVSKWFHTTAPGIFLGLIILLASCFLVAELTYRFIEQPFIRRGRRVTAA